MIELKDLKDGPDEVGIWWVINESGRFIVNVFYDDGFFINEFGSLKNYHIDNYSDFKWISNSDYIRQHMEAAWFGAIEFAVDDLNREEERGISLVGTTKQ